MPERDRKCVVIVEDDPSMSNALERILRLGGGHASRTYASAEAYLENDAGCEAACLIIDVQLPGMSGFELHARVAPLHANVPVIFITAFDTPEARAKAHEAGAAGFLVKPFSGRLLLETVGKVVAAV